MGFLENLKAKTKIVVDKVTEKASTVIAQNTKDGLADEMQNLSKIFGTGLIIYNIFLKDTSSSTIKPASVVLQLISAKDLEKIGGK